MKTEKAFPNPHRTDMTGMTLRDYFAAKVLPQCLQVCGTKATAAEEAYRIADAMLKAREQ